MTDAGFFRGTSAEQDNRFSDKEKKLMKQMRFGENVLKKVDTTKVKIDVLRPWITKRIEDLLGMEDDVIEEFVVNQLEGEQHPDGRRIQINLTGFLNGKNARIFTAELWDMLLSAQEQSTGIPASLIESKQEEIKKRNEEQEKEKLTNTLKKTVSRFADKLKTEPDSPSHHGSHSHSTGNSNSDIPPLMRSSSSIGSSSNIKREKTTPERSSRDVDFSKRKEDGGRRQYRSRRTSSPSPSRRSRSRERDRGRSDRDRDRERDRGDRDRGDRDRGGGDRDRDRRDKDSISTRDRDRRGSGRVGGGLTRSRTRSRSPIGKLRRSPIPPSRPCRDRERDRSGSRSRSRSRERSSATNNTLSSRRYSDHYERADRERERERERSNRTTRREDYNYNSRGSQNTGGGGGGRDDRNFAQDGKISSSRNRSPSPSPRRERERDRPAPALYEYTERTGGSGNGGGGGRRPLGRRISEEREREPEVQRKYRNDPDSGEQSNDSGQEENELQPRKAKKEKKSKKDRKKHKKHKKTKKSKKSRNGSATGGGSGGPTDSEEEDDDPENESASEDSLQEQDPQPQAHRDGGNGRDRDRNRSNPGEVYYRSGSALGDGGLTGEDLEMEKRLRARALESLKKKTSSH